MAEDQIPEEPEATKAQDAVNAGVNAPTEAPAHGRFDYWQFARATMWREVFGWVAGRTAPKAAADSKESGDRPPAHDDQSQPVDRAPHGGDVDELVADAGGSSNEVAQPLGSLAPPAGDAGREIAAASADSPPSEDEVISGGSTVIGVIDAPPPQPEQPILQAAELASAPSVVVASSGAPGGRAEDREGTIEGRSEGGEARLDAPSAVNDRGDDGPLGRTPDTVQSPSEQRGNPVIGDQSHVAPSPDFAPPVSPQPTQDANAGMPPQEATGGTPTTDGTVTLPTDGVTPPTDGQTPPQEVAGGTPTTDGTVAPPADSTTAPPTDGHDHQHDASSGGPDDDRTGSANDDRHEHGGGRGDGHDHQHDASSGGPDDDRTGSANDDRHEHGGGRGDGHDHQHDASSGGPDDDRTGSANDDRHEHGGGRGDGHDHQHDASSGGPDDHGRTPPGHDPEHHASNGRSDADGPPIGHDSPDGQGSDRGHDAHHEALFGTPDHDTGQDHHDGEHGQDAGHHLGHHGDHDSAAGDNPYMSLVPHDHHDQSAALPNESVSGYLTGVGIDPASVPAVDHQAMAQADIIHPAGHDDGGASPGFDEHGSAHDGAQGHEASHGDSPHSSDHHDVDMSPPPEPPPDMSHQHG